MNIEHLTQDFRDLGLSCPDVYCIPDLIFHAFLPSAYEQPDLAVESWQMYVSLK